MKEKLGPLTSQLNFTRFGRWAKEDEKRDLTDADIIDKLKRATGLTNEMLLHNILLKMKNVPPAAIYALSECDGKIIQQLTLTGRYSSSITPTISFCLYRQTIHSKIFRSSVEVIKFNQN